MIDFMAPSEEVKNFHDFLHECRRIYDDSYANVGIEDKRGQDILHAIEFEDSPASWETLYKKLRESRMVRRRNKDLVEVLYPVIEFIEDPRNKKTLDLIPRLLGEIRKVEDKQKKRSYHPRVEDALGI